jgi:tRNA-specific 2-thiouridylase
MKTDLTKKVVVAMSGGVDSSVSAALLKRSGFDVVGIFMKFWKDGKSADNSCCSIESEKLARAVAKQIGIPFYVLNAEKEFKKTVVDYFLAEYKKGNTPNPCVVCNKTIKFGFLINKALSLGADFVATGHYCRTGNARSATSFSSLLVTPFVPAGTSGPGAAKSLLPRLYKGEDSNKDQSYFLWQLDQKQLSHVLFPVGGYTKSEVRKLAKKFKLPTAETPESQEVCFIQDTTNNFLKKYLKSKPGKIIDKSGKILGQHQGLWFYTIGQRRGLEIQQGPWFVVDKDFKKNILIVSKNEKDLEKKELIAKDVNWITPQKLPLNAEVKIRYKSNLAKAKISKNVKSIKIVFQKPQKAVTPGQSAVFYKGKELIGGGVIQ